MNTTNHAEPLWIGPLLLSCLLLVGCGGPSEPTAETNPPPPPPPEELEYRAVLEMPADAPESSPENQADAPDQTGPAEPVNTLVPPSPRTSPLLKRRDFLTRWAIAGPLSNDERQALAPAELAGPDLPTPSRPWHHAEAAKAPAGFVDLAAIVNRSPNGTALAVAWLESPSAMENCRLNIGSTGPVKAWLNGTEILDDPAAPRTARWDQSSAEGLRIKPGRNVLLLELRDSDAEAWGFFARLTDAAGRPLQTRSD